MIYYFYNFSSINTKLVLFLFFYKILSFSEEGYISISHISRKFS